MIDKIKGELKRRIREDYNGDEHEDEIAQGVCASMLYYINSLEEESVSEDLEEAAEKYGYSKDQVTECGTEYTTIELIRAFIDGAKWQEMKYKTEKCDKVKLMTVKE